MPGKEKPDAFAPGRGIDCFKGNVVFFGVLFGIRTCRGIDGEVRAIQ